VIRGEGKLIENDTYKRQLDNFFDCAELAEKIRDTPYKILSMLNLFNVYYATCLKKKPEFTRTESYKTDFYFGLSGRGTLIYISAKKFPTLNYSSETSFLTFSGGGYFTLEAVSRKNLGKRSFYSEFGVFGYQINSTSVEEYMNKPDTKTINLGLLYARSGHFLRFMSKNKNGIRTYFGVGVMLGLVLSSDFSYVNTYTSLSRPMTVRYSGKRFFEPKEFEMGFGLQFGVRSRRFCAELRTDYGDGFSPFVVVRTHTFYGSATVGVIF
jgi:hypothetical protein